MLRQLAVFCLLFSFFALAGDRYLHISKVGGHFKMQGELQGNLHGVEKVFGWTGQTLYRTLSSGYFHFKTAQQENIYLFVSPFEAVFAEREEVNWYRTQFDTSTTSNCGPSSVSMGIGWARGIYIPVAQIRDEVGFQGVGGTSLDQLEEALRRHKVGVESRAIKSIDEIRNLIDQGHILLVLYTAGMVARNTNDARVDFTGRHFEYEGGHYNIIKGYTKDGRYLIVNDPIPGDWSKNSFRHNDGISMKGQNRFYPAQDFFKSIHVGRVLVLSQNKMEVEKEYQLSLTESVILGRYSEALKQGNEFYLLCTNQLVATAGQKETIAELMKKLDAGNCETAYQRAIRLTTLKLEKTQISDLTPLKGFISLRRLDFGGNHFRDASAIGYLSKLEELNLWGSKLADVSFLSSLINLRKLYLWGKDISDPSVIGKLQKLSSLSLWGNGFDDLAFIYDLPILMRLELGGASIDELQIKESYRQYRQYDRWWWTGGN